MLCVCVSGDGGELLQQDILTQRGQRHVLPHVQADGADLEGGQGDRGTGVGLATLVTHSGVRLIC